MERSAGFSSERRDLLQRNRKPTVKTAYTMNQSLTTLVPLFDAYSPPQIAERVREIGVAKANAPLLTTLALAVLAGAFISLGALFYTVTVTGADPSERTPFGLLQLAGGGAFSLGLVLVVVGGAELFTGNNLLAMAWAAGRVQSGQILRNWGWVYLGNLVGALGTAALVLLSGVHELADGAVGETAIRIARTKSGSWRVGIGGARDSLQRPRVPGGLALHGSPQRRRQDPCHCVSHQRFCRLRVRAFGRKYVFSSDRTCAYLGRDRPNRAGGCLRQSRPGDGREPPGRDSPGRGGLLVCLFTGQLCFRRTPPSAIASNPRAG